jgi:hypothetical protein
MRSPNRRPTAGLAILVVLAQLLVAGCGDNTAEPDISLVAGHGGSSFAESAGQTIAEAALSGEYFPLNEGDHWVYRITEDSGQRLDFPEVVEVRVVASRTLGGHLVYDFDSYLYPFSSEQVRFFRGPDGEAFEMLGSRIGVWYPGSFLIVETPIRIPALRDDCIHGTRGTYLGNYDTVTVPAGTFERSVRLHYSWSPCKGIGLSEEILAPEVGLIQRTVSTTPGTEVTWSLVSAVVGGRSWPDAPAAPYGDGAMTED